MATVAAVAILIATVGAPTLATAAAADASNQAIAGSPASDGASGAGVFQAEAISAVQSDVVSPTGDKWSYYIAPDTLQCSATSMTLFKNAWNSTAYGYCGTFVTVNSQIFGMDVQNMPWEINSQHPTPYTVVDGYSTGIGSVRVGDAGSWGVRVWQTSEYNPTGDGWISTVTVRNYGLQTVQLRAQIIAGRCASFNGVEAIERFFDPDTHRASCRNGLNVVTFEPPAPGVGWFPGTQNVWGQGKEDLEFEPGDSLTFSTEIKWRKDGSLPAGQAPLPEWYGLAPWQSFANGAPDVSTAQCDCADPVNSATGEYWQTDTDLSLPGRSPIDLTRTYSSMADAAPGIFGAGWTSLLDTHVVPGDPTYVVHANGSATEFTPTEDGTFSADPDVRATLSQNAGTGEYTYRLREHTSYVFDGAGKLNAIVDHNGEVTHVTRSSSTVAIVSPDGRTATYQLDGQGRATNLSGPDARSVSFGYGTDGLLATVTDARAQQWGYTYDSAGRMVTETAPLSGTITTTYDNDGRVSTQTNRRGGETTFAYTQDGVRSTTRIVDPAGVTTDWTYDHGLLASKTIDPDGQPATWRYTYDLNGNQQTATSPTSERVWQTFDTEGRLISRTDEAGLTTTYTYGDLDVPLTRADPLGTTTWTYDTHGNVLTETRPRNGVDAATTFQRDPAHPGDILSITDPDGHVTGYTYNAAGFALTSTAPDTGKSTWTRNSYGQPLTQVSPRGNAAGATPADYKTQFTYDPAGTLKTTTDPLGHTRTYGLDIEGRATSITNALGKTSLVAFLADGNIGSVTGPAGHTTTFTLDLAGKLLATTDPSGAVTTTQYDAHGWPVSTTSPSGNVAGADAPTRAAHTQTLTHDLTGRVTSTSVPNPDDPGAPIVTSTKYDAAGRVASVVDALGNETFYGYGYSTGLLNDVTDPAGGYTSYGYDEYGDVTRTTDALSHATTTTYTPGGAVASVKNAANEITRYTYDPAGRLASIVDPRGTCSGCTAANYTVAFGYDVDGNRTTVTDQLGRITTSQYDRAGRQVSQKDANNHTTTYTYYDDNNLLTTTAPDTGVTTVTYDNAGNVTRLRTPRGNNYDYTYDANGRVLTAADPLGRTESTAYTPEGLIAQLTTARGNASPTPATGTINYAYDTLGRLIETTFGDAGAPVTFAYDADSRVTDVHDGAGHETRGYDANGRTTSIVRNTENWSYTYKADGTLETITRPDATTETWTYDAAARAKTVTTPQGVTSFTYDKASNLTQTSHPNGTSETQTWDRANYLASLTTKRGTTNLIAQTITRDNIGNPTQVATTRSTKSETRSYLYDANDRLQAVCYVARTSCTGASAATQYWTYDPDGNRLTEKNGTATGTTTTYTYDTASQLKTSKVGTAAATTYTYDPDGNLTTNGTTTWTYDLDNRVTSSTTGAAALTWTRDAAGNPVTIASPSGTTSYQWDNNRSTPALATSSEASGTTIYRYDPLGRLSAITAGTTTATVGHDLVGSPTDLINSAGAIARSYDFAPFGTPRAAIGAPTTPTGPTSAVAYGGLLTTADAATLTARDRNYLTGFGRWTGTDPIGIPTASAFTSPYGYVSNAPNRYVDPLGQFDCDYYSDLCAVGSFLKGANYGAEAAMESAILAAIDPLDTIDQAIKSCRAAAASDPNAPVRACLGAPLAAFGDALRETFTNPCMEEAGKAFGGAWFNATLVVASAGGGVGLARGLAASRAAGTVPVGAAVGAVDAGDHIVLGLKNFGLESTAAKLGGRTLLSDLDWQDTLRAAVTDPSTRFTVSLDGMSGASTYSQVMNAAQRGSAGAGGYTDWEMAQLYQAGRLGETTFVRGGTVVENPFAP